MTRDVDQQWMRLALELAERGAYTTTPNPRVGCVIVRDAQLLGEGWHESAGSPHAEVNALADASRRGHDPRGATAYVSLEPCCHHGRTPPCTDALIRAGIRRVVAACNDPNPVAAHGGDVLRAAGIEFESGLLEQQARELNCGFISRIQRHRPWLRSKLAMSLDGRTALADGQSQWITGAAARADGHRFRARACAILTGIGTVLADNPALTVRGIATPRQPLRIVLDRQAQTPANAALMNDGGKTLIVTAQKRPAHWNPAVESLLLPASGDRYTPKDILALLQQLAARGINEIHVEAGAQLNGFLLAAGLIDELLLYVSPRLLGQDARPLFSLAGQPDNLETYHCFDFFNCAQVGDDVRLQLRRKENPCLQASSLPPAPSGQ